LADRNFDQASQLTAPAPVAQVGIVPLGATADVRQAIERVFPGTYWNGPTSQGLWGTWLSANGAVEFALRRAGQHVVTVTLHLTTGEAMLPAIINLTELLGCQAIDEATGEAITRASISVSGERIHRSEQRWREEAAGDATMAKLYDTFDAERRLAAVLARLGVTRPRRASTASLQVFQRYAWRRGVPLAVVEQLAVFYDVTDGVDQTDWSIYNADDRRLFDQWRQLRLCLGQWRGADLTWENKSFCLRPSPAGSPPQGFQADSLEGLLLRLADWRTISRPGQSAGAAELALRPDGASDRLRHMAANSQPVAQLSQTSDQPVEDSDDWSRMADRSAAVAAALRFEQSVDPEIVAAAAEERQRRLTAAAIDNPFPQAPAVSIEQAELSPPRVVRAPAGYAGVDMVRAGEAAVTPKPRPLANAPTGESGDSPAKAEPLDSVAQSGGDAVSLSQPSGDVAGGLPPSAPEARPVTPQRPRVEAHSSWRRSPAADPVTGETHFFNGDQSRRPAPAADGTVDQSVSNGWRPSSQYAPGSAAAAVEAALRQLTDQRQHTRASGRPVTDGPLSSAESLAESAKQWSPVGDGRTHDQPGVAIGRGYRPGEHGPQGSPQSAAHNGTEFNPMSNASLVAAIDMATDYLMSVAQAEAADGRAEWVASTDSTPVVTVPAVSLPDQSSGFAPGPGPVGPYQPGPTGLGHPGSADLVVPAWPDGRVFAPDGVRDSFAGRKSRRLAQPQPVDDGWSDPTALIVESWPEQAGAVDVRDDGWADADDQPISTVGDDGSWTGGQVANLTVDDQATLWSSPADQPIDGSVVDLPDDLFRSNIITPERRRGVTAQAEEAESTLMRLINRQRLFGDQDQALAVAESGDEVSAETLARGDAPTISSDNRQDQPRQPAPQVQRPVDQSSDAPTGEKWHLTAATLLDWTEGGDASWTEPQAG
jgi:hypothetical protein